MQWSPRSACASTRVAESEFCGPMTRTAITDMGTDVRNSSPTTPKRCAPEVVLASNENPNNLPVEITTKSRSGWPSSKFNRYPNPSSPRPTGSTSENVLVGNGGDEIIYNLLAGVGWPRSKFLDMPADVSMYGIDAPGPPAPRSSRFLAARTSPSTRPQALARVAEGPIDIVVVAQPQLLTGGLCQRIVPHRAAQVDRCHRHGG